MTVRITAPLTDTEATSGRRLVWLASAAAGHPLGSASLRLFTAPGQQHLAELDLQVHPAERRRGTGSRLLAAATDAARADGRRSLLAQADEGSPADAFLAARGFRPVLTLRHARLPLADTDPAALAALVARPHPGYRLVSWDGAVPDELLATFTASRRAMDDMPMDETDYGTVTWDAARVLDAAAAVARRGELLHTVAAVDESDGSVVGFTELVVPGDGTGDAQHYGTGVLPEHRGRGLSTWMKAESVLAARRRHPRLAGLLTDTADSNAPMRAVNHVLGYRPTHTALTYQLDL
ncbi:GNAT family N-acetyltransferase [Kitasatospora paracochleata]|uniref:GNAT superfamily N-acetyltransferase n=2 Tax=Kitasatospora paracochleata TaxID=58354 RepID=A0ABT1J260_9ACTN|nr:GNAT family N-acetyltransferase [Kitasatospora paracochleata]MCP2311234.1 GNAT superfamily N-acetyltransferase [Kitasatospora paracochleata]